LADDAVRDLDLTYLIALGDGAIPAIVERLPALPDRERNRLVGALRTLHATRHDATGWQGWNWDRARASELLSDQ
jgi:hypothetical protein